MERPQQSSFPPPASLPKYLRQDFLTRRCKELLSTLPAEKGWLTSSSHLYRGFWIETAFLNATLSCQSHFQARNEDIVLASFPKSGTTWLKAAVYALTHRSSHNVSDSVEQDHPLLTKSPHDLIPFLEIDLYYQSECPNLSSFSNPRIFATHIPYSLLPGSMKDSGCKIIYMCRDPKDTLISYWHFTNRLRQSSECENTLEEVLDQLCSGRSPFGPFWDHILEYWKASLEMPERVLFLKYEEMMERPGEAIRRMADFIGCQVPEDAMKDIATMCSFENLSRLEANKNGNVPSGAESRLFFRRGKVGDWTNFLSPEMSEKIDLTMGEKLSGSGLKF